MCSLEKWSLIFVLLSLYFFCRELDGLLVEQCTVDTDTTTGQTVPAVIGNYRKISFTIWLFLSTGQTCNLDVHWWFVVQPRKQVNIMALHHYASLTIHKGNLFLCDIGVNPSLELWIIHMHTVYFKRFFPRLFLDREIWIIVLNCEIYSCTRVREATHI